ncbi:MAG TPA: phenylalanine--tRNA ligase subunit alpha [Polyangiaceae bacterium]|nr:phenylalanine--tRNA ligase subunit alpha [Polyangiaceae bacterium]
MSAANHPIDGITRSLEALRATFRSRFEAATTEQQLRDENAKILGKKGELTPILKQMGGMPAEDKKAVGELVNALKRDVQAAFDDRLAAIAKARRDAELNAPKFDLTLPARVPAALGHAHPISIVRDEIVDVLVSLGFAVHDGPEVELEENNFGRLGYPPDHPATDMQDTFWVDVRAKGAAASKGAPEGQGLAPTLLRSHTSNIQVRAMLGHEPPMAFIAPGTVYRRDDDATHSPMFHQIECFLIDRNVSMAHLKGVLAEFAERFFGAGTPIRMRPSYFPFVEPGAEVDVGCPFCKRVDGTRAGCSVCKRTGWIEILGCGMIHPAVFESCGVDPEQWTGFAFGLGLERVAVIRYGIPDMRLLFENDPRFLAQF